MDSQADAQRALEYWRLEGWREIGRELGRGSYAAVVEVDYKGLKCVGKKIHRILYENGERELIQRFEEECRLLSQLRHPHVVQFLGVYFEEHTNVPVLVMEFLPTTLAQALDRYGLLPDEINYSILRDVSLGLRYLHERPNPIVHRDLSANNVLLTRDMTAKISDLGVARMLGLTPIQMKRMTQGPGTPCYMPPEALVSDPHYDVKIDIFSFGCLILHVLSGEWPFPKEAVQVNPGAPSELTPVSEMDRRSQCIEKIPVDHPLIQLISQCLHNSPIERPPIVDVCQRVDDIASQHPAAFENRVELLRRIHAAQEEGASLRNEVQILHGERDDYMKQNQKALEAQIGQHEATVTRLEEEFHSKIERLQTDCDLHQCHSEAEMQQLHARLTELRDENNSLWETKSAKDRVHEAQLEAERKGHRVQIDALVLQHTNEKEKQQADFENLQKSMATIQEQLQTVRNQYDDLMASQLQIKEKEKESQLQIKEIEKEAQLQIKEAEKAALLVELEESRSRVSRKEATIETLREQLGRTQEMLLHKSQIHTPFPPGAELVWSKCANFPVDMRYTQAILIDESLYIGGGHTANTSDPTLVSKYSIVKRNWSQLPSAPVKYFGLGRLKENVVLVGGSDALSEEFKAVDKLYTFDDTQQWVESFPPMPTVRLQPTVISYKGLALIVCGGEGESEKYVNIVELFKIETSQWCGLHPLPFPWSGMSVATMGDTCFLMGGWINDGDLTQTVLQCKMNELIQCGSDQDSPNTPWKALPDCPKQLSTPAVLNGCVLAIGGGDTYSKKRQTISTYKHIYVYCSSISKWVMVGELPSDSVTHTAVVLSTNELLVFGGTLGTTLWRGKVELA